MYEPTQKEFRTETCTKTSYPSVFGKTVTLPMLLKSGILVPGKSTMSIEYMGQKFIGDLLDDGKIKSQETETIFCSPSAWAINCKKIINPDKKSGCGWASVKYKGKKLDIYKAMYHKKCQQQKDEEDIPSEDEEKEVITKPVELPVPPKKNLLQHSAICNQTILQDINMLVEAVPFSNIGRVQPFLVNITSSATLLIDFHSHLTTNEVCGYLGGTWDFNTHNLNITHTFPLLNTRFDREKSAECEYEIQKAMLDKNIQLVGWYHSHPRFSAHPTLRDCDKQMDYQIKLRGTSDTTYTPCVGFIFASYDAEDEDVEEEGKMMPFWVLPPPENRPHELGRPMSMTYNIIQDEKLPDEIKEQMSTCINYYRKFQFELLDFSEMKLKDDVMVLEKVKNSMFQRFPIEDQNTGELWNWILELIGLEREDPVVIPKKIFDKKKRLEDEARERENLLREQEEKKLRDEQEATKQALNAISSLQQQLSQPSGLNMTPSPISSAIISLPATTNHKQSTSSNATNTSSSPRDSPATIPSTATSPAKFEVPIRASPSPAKSDTSSVRARNSPAPSPAKLPERPPRNSSSVSSTSSKYDLGYSSNNLSDLYAATLASFAKNLPPGLLPNDYASFLQGSKMSDFGITDYHHQQHHHENVRETTSKRKGRPPSNHNQNQNNYDYEGYKSEVGKIADLMKSPEYTQMLMNQANAFRGLGSEITVTRKSSNNNSPSSNSNKKASPSTSTTTTVSATSNQSNYSQSSNNNSASKSSLLQHLPVMDLNYLAEIY
ncbi:CLUMA_CG014499, isoform A [Clunio marinus]|uniref:CLUMA_CG014499, isoform A n=1 Tax=Clunio marinus TaxID=568069 RepID=A0A1J1ILA9_9DIPT|nr:CLUMA_CG014499, isoform A [Clunio marinus]